MLYAGNTRVVGQRELENFRTEMTEHVNDPYTVVMRNSKLPMGLLSDPYKVHLSFQKEFEIHFNVHFFLCYRQLFTYRTPE